MKVLIWNSPWIAQGDLLFYRNCFVRHLAVQANTLARAGVAVDVVVNSMLARDVSILDSNINRISVDMLDILEMGGSLVDPSKSLYEGSDRNFVQKLVDLLRGRLSRDYDAILLWETPVPFLETLFPQSLIVHQMPGIFSRAPYPHTVVFDPVGLYKQGALYKHSDAVLRSVLDDGSVVSEFREHSKRAVAELQPFGREILRSLEGFNRVSLLPLQVSAHYAFQADTPYTSQAEFLLDVLRQTPSETALVATQYVSPRVSDAALNEDIVFALKQTWGNLVYEKIFDKINGVSQYLIPFVNSVVSCSSSIAIQSMIWGRELIVPHDTFISPYSDANITGRDIQRQDAHDRVLDFVLERHQPLCDKITKDASFLIALLNELIERKRTGRTGTESFVRFADLDNRYHESLISSFKIPRAAKELKTVGVSPSAYHEEAGKFSKIINRSEVKVISFDIFDTLLCRPFEVPTDLFRFMEADVRRTTGGAIDTFAAARVAAENSLRESIGDGEITLGQIYQEIGDRFGLNDETREQLLQLEVEAELYFATARPAGKRLWELAVLSGKELVLISDMYLSEEHISTMLRKAGYVNYKKLYVSSELNAKKKDGRLFDVVLADLGCTPAAVVHVGDNRVADVEQPTAKGMASFRIFRAIDRMRGNEYYKELFEPRSGVGERPRAVIAGLIASTLFDAPSGESEKTSLFSGRPFNLGYSGLGPLVTGYALWLGRQAKRDQVDRLYFLSREGWLLKQAYDALHADDPTAVKSTYLYASRRATRVAALRSREDVLMLANSPYRDGVRLEHLLSDRFGLTITESLREKVDSLAILKMEASLVADVDGRRAFSTISEQLAEEILAVAAAERAAYLRYLEQEGLCSAGKFAVVDIGWKANMQGALGAILEKSLVGYYYATLYGAEQWLESGHQITAYSGEFVSLKHPGAVLGNRPLSEFLVCHSEPSFQCMTIGELGKLEPRFKNESDGHIRRPLIDEVHRGAIRFARDVATKFDRYLATVYFDPFLVERIFAQFLCLPAAVDASLLEGQIFEDGFGGVPRQYLVAPRGKGQSVWRRGAEALVAKVPAKVLTASPTKAKASVGASVQKVLEPKSLDHGIVLRRFERLAIKLFVADRKYKKYLRDRREFFMDSKSMLFRRWYAWMQ